MPRLIAVLLTLICFMATTTFAGVSTDFIPVDEPKPDAPQAVTVPGVPSGEIRKEEKSSTWYWWVLGAVVVGAGAAIALSGGGDSGSSKSSTSTSTTSTPGSAVIEW